MTVPVTTLMGVYNSSFDLRTTITIDETFFHSQDGCPDEPRRQLGGKVAENQ